MSMAQKRLYLLESEGLKYKFEFITVYKSLSSSKLSKDNMLKRVRPLGQFHRSFSMPWSVEDRRFTGLRLLL